MITNPRVIVISCGGSISSVGANSLDLIEYTDVCGFLEINDLLARFPEITGIAEIVTIQFESVGSSAIGPTQWLKLVSLIHDAVRTDQGAAGVVIVHGTATIEETGYFLNLVLKTDVPVILVGAQRPPSAVSSDAGMNLINAIRTASCSAARGKGVLVLLNDEIHAVREITKTSTLRLNTFRTPDFGILGHADGDNVHFYRSPIRRRAPDTAFDVSRLSSLPRVDICYSSAGSDGDVVDALCELGAQGIVSAGFPPGLGTPSERSAFERATKRGIAVVQSTRGWSGRVAPRRKLIEMGIVTADNLSPQKARILLMLALTHTKDRGEIQRYFDEY
jgi:L-asparaginase